MPGESWFRLPVGAGAPPLVDGSLGLTRLVARASDSYRMQVAVLDCDRARLLRAGITVAHRRRDDRPGQWYVAAPSWPGLPDEQVYELDASGNLPESVLRRLRLFLRGQALGPFATVDLERHAWTLHGPDGPLLELTDDVVHVSVGDDERPPTRELTLRPVGTLDDAQWAHVRAALASVDAEPATLPSTMAERIGPPATNLTTLREPRPLTVGMSLEDFVAETMLGHLRGLIVDELTFDDDATGAELGRLQRTLRGFSAVLHPQWRESVEADVRALPGASDEDREPMLLRVLEALVGAVRAPQLGDLSTEDAMAVLLDRIEQLIAILRERAWALGPLSQREEWSSALRSARQLDAALTTLAPLLGKQAKRLKRLVDDALPVLERAVQAPEDIELVGLTVEEAFQLGRDVEHAQWTMALARRDFIDRWPRWAADGRKALDKLQDKMRRRLA